MFELKYKELLKRLVNTKECSDPNRPSSTRKKLDYHTLSFDTDHVPVLYCKKSFIASAVDEFNMFMSFDMNISNLKAGFWNDDAYNYYLRLCIREGHVEALALNAFLLLKGEECSYIPNYKYGDLGPVYGNIWKEQINNMISLLKKDINTTSALVINTDYRIKNDNLKRALEPCHLLFQISSINEKDFSLNFVMRSSDVFLGLPMNVLFYYLMGLYIAKETKYNFKRMNIGLNNPHLYENSYGHSKILANSKSEIKTLLKPCFEFITKPDGSVKCVYSPDIDHQIYNETVKHIPVKMLAYEQ